MKTKVCFFIAFVLLLTLFSSFALANVEEDYDAMRSLLQSVIDNPDDAAKSLERVIKYYEKNGSGLKGYKQADYIYRYAKGRVYLSQGDADNAYLQFYGLTEFVEGLELEYYLTFCDAMMYKADAELYGRKEDYADAIEYFTKAKDLTDSPAAAVDQIAQCETGYAEALKKEAAEYCKKGQHDKAQAVYDMIIDFSNKMCARDGKKLKEACIAHSTAVGKDAYEYGTACMNVGNYADAYAYFAGAGTYEDSQLKMLYCQGMMAIEAANELESKGTKPREELAAAKSCFSNLSSVQYEGAENLYKYCWARECEINGNTQKAIDLFAELAGVFDSTERYRRLDRGEKLVLAEPAEKPPEKVTTVPGRALRSVDVYTGPGNQYQKIKDLKINAESEFVVCAEESGYYLIEMKIDKQMIRGWVQKERVIKDDSVTIFGKTRRDTRLTKDVKLYYGPGNEYAQWDISLKKGTKITAYDAEDVYTMIEFTYDGVKYRAWVKTENLNN